MIKMKDKIEKLIEFATKDRDGHKPKTKRYIHKDGYLKALKDIRLMLERE